MARMAEEKQQHAAPANERPGTGIDRTVIRDLLVLTPEERVKLMIASARNLADFLAASRRR